MAEHDLEPPPRIWWLRLWDVAGAFLAFAGITAVALFIARLAFALA